MHYHCYLIAVTLSSNIVISVHYCWLPFQVKALLPVLNYTITASINLHSFSHVGYTPLYASVLCLEAYRLYDLFISTYLTSNAAWTAYIKHTHIYSYIEYGLQLGAHILYSPCVEIIYFLQHSCIPSSFEYCVPHKIALFLLSPRLLGPLVLVFRILNHTMLWAQPQSYGSSFLIFSTLCHRTLKSVYQMNISFSSS